MGFYLLSSSSVILLGSSCGLTVMNATPAQSLKRWAQFARDSSRVEVNEKNMRIYLIIIFSVLIVSSCKLTEQNIAGKYHDYQNFENSAVLQIFPNHNFKYSMQAGLLFLNASGKWTIISDTLILSNSDSTSIIELRQMNFLIKGRKLVEIRDDGLKTVTLK